MASADVVVIGGGIAGTAVALELARRKLDVVLCEQGRTPGEGATTWSGGLLRQHHTAHCNTPLAVRSLPVFEHWADVVGGDCGYRRTGFVMIVARQLLGNLRHNAAVVDAAGGVTEIISGEALTQRFRALACDESEGPDLVAAYEPDGGYVDPAACARSLLAAAVGHGARFSEGVAVAGIVVERGRVAGVDTSLGRVCAPVVVLAAGAWSPRLAQAIGVQLPVEPRRIGIARAAIETASDTLPAGIDDTLATYWRPAGGHPGAGVYFGVAADPAVVIDARPAPITKEEAESAGKAIGARIPAVRRVPVSGARAGFDGYTPDRHPVIGSADLPGLFMCTGFSGGGVKIAPAVARMLAAEIADGQPDPLLAPYQPGRFAAGKLIESEYPYAHS
jgi:glycine/D-amino acid oxidase-like deaminating enzyme